MAAKTVALILALALIASPDVIRIRRAAAAGGGPTYIFNEDAEGTGTPSGWTNTGSPDWDEATTVLDGAQSLEMVGAATNPRAHYDSGAAYDEVWVRFKWRVSTQVSGFRILSLRNQSGDSEVAYLQTGGTNQLQVINGSGNCLPVSTYSAATTYNIWIRYKKGTGSNSEMSVGFTTGTTEPTSGNDFCSLTNGTATAQINRFQFRLNSGTSDHVAYFDRMTGDDVAIGNF